MPEPPHIGRGSGRVDARKATDGRGGSFQGAAAVPRLQQRAIKEGPPSPPPLVPRPPF